MYELPESLTVFNSEEVLESLGKYVSSYIEGQGQSDKVVIDATKLIDLDGAGLQLLLSAYKTCELRNIPFHITGIDKEIMTLLEITGTKDMLESEEI